MSRHKSISETEFLEKGGSPVTVDLANLMHDRVGGAIQSVVQLSDDKVGSTILYTTAVMVALTHHFTFACAREKKLIDENEYMDAVIDGVRDHVRNIRRLMQKQYKDGYSYFDDLMEAIKKAESGS